FGRLPAGGDWRARVPDRVDQLVSDPRLGQVRGPQGPSQLHIGLGHPTGQEDGRQVRPSNLFAQNGQQPHPIHARQTDVKDSHVRADTLGHHAQRRLGVVNGYHLVTLTADPHREKLLNGSVILNDQSRQRSSFALSGRNVLLVFAIGRNTSRLH